MRLRATSKNITCDYEISQLEAALAKAKQAPAKSGQQE